MIGLLSGCIFSFIILSIEKNYTHKVFGDSIKNISKQDNESLVLNAKVVDIHDGDTITVSVTKQFAVRFLDCWCAEINAKDEKEKNKGIEAKKFLQKMIKVNDEVSVEIPLYENIGKSITFNRFLGYVWKDVNGDGIKENLSKEMVDNNYATKRKDN